MPSSPRTLAAIFSLCGLLPDVQARAGKILLRLSTNLHCLLPFLLHRHLPFLLLARDRLAAELCPCSPCSLHMADIRSLVTQLHHNLSLLAETGYGEGELCHRLVSPHTPATDRLAISISAPLLLRQKKLLRNVLVTHDSLDCLLDLLETSSSLPPAADPCLAVLPQAVLALSHLARHLGLQAPLPALEEPGEPDSCCRGEEHLLGGRDHLTLTLDCGACLTAARSVLTASSSVFAAMLEGGFSESSQGTVPLPLTSAPATAITRFPGLDHHDPFDRLLLAQALDSSLWFETADKAILALGLPEVRDAQA